MSEDIKQPVATEADTQAKPVSEADSARTEPDLDTLLATYDEQTTKPASPPAPAATPQQPDNAVLEEIRALKGIAQEWQQNKFKSEIADTVKDIRGDLDPELFDNDLVEAWLDAKARKEPRLQQAWTQKDANPKQWSGIKRELGREFKKKFDRMPDRQATEDRDAVSAAVRAASTKAPTEQPANLGGMSTAEYRQHIRQQYGFDPQV